MQGTALRSLHILIYWMLIMSVKSLWNTMHARHCPEVFTFTNLLNAHNDPVTKELLILLFQFYTWENWGREMLDNLCQATQWQSQRVNLENSTPESTVLTNPLFYFLNRVFSIPCFRGVFPNTNIMNSTVRKCLSSPLSIMYILSSLRISSVGKMKNRGVENCGETAKDMMSPKSQIFYNPVRSSLKEEPVWTGKLSETSLWRVSLHWVLKNEQDLV